MVLETVVVVLLTEVVVDVRLAVVLDTVVMSHSDETVVVVLFTLFTRSPSRILNYVALRHQSAKHHSPPNHITNQSNHTM